MKKYFVKNEELDDIDLEDFGSIFPEKKTKTNVCMYRINKDGDSEEKGSYFIRKDLHVIHVVTTKIELSFTATVAGWRLNMKVTTLSRSTVMTPCATVANLA